VTDAFSVINISKKQRLIKPAIEGPNYEESDHDLAPLGFIEDRLVLGGKQHDVPRIETKPGSSEFAPLEGISQLLQQIQDSERDFLTSCFTRSTQKFTIIVLPQVSSTGKPHAHFQGGLIVKVRTGASHISIGLAN